MQISQRANSIAASQSLAMAARAKKMRAEGIDVISMSLGEPDMDTPEHIRRAAQEAIDNHWSHYGPVPGIPSLREAIAESSNLQIFESSNPRIFESSNPQIFESSNPQIFESSNPRIFESSNLQIFESSNLQIIFHPEDVIVSIGAKMAIYNAIQTLINPGDEVIIPMPSWVSYTEMVKLSEGKVVPVVTTYEDNYLLTPHQLRAALSERTRMLILCSPNNPTGSVYSRAQLQALIDVLRDFPNVTILSDEIYRCLTYGCEAPGLASFPELQDRLVIVNGVSKAYAMTGYRIGWLLSKNRAFLSACTRLQGQQLTCATMVAQKAAEAALTGPQECVAEMRQTFAERRELICRLASEVPGFRFREPQGAFYLFPDVSAIGSGDEVAERLLDEAHVAVVSGSAFGCPECIRLSYAISTEEIEEAMRRIKIALS